MLYTLRDHGQDRTWTIHRSLTSFCVLSQVTQTNSRAQRRIKSAGTNLSKPTKPKNQNNNKIVRAPVATTRSFRTSQPRIRATHKTCVITHKEYLSDISGSNAVAFPAIAAPGYNAYLVNPSNPGVFPWLSGVAPLYETYKFRKLKFSYQPACSTSTLGRIMAAFDYDASDLPPASKTQLMSNDGAVQTATWNEIEIPASQAGLNKQKNYYTNFTVSNNPDLPSVLRQNNVGTFYLMAIGQATENVIGELFVEYEIELSTPQLETNSRSYYLGNVASPVDFLALSTIVRGNIPIFRFSGSRLRFDQEFIGLLTLEQHGTGITTVPTFAVHLGTQTSQIEYGGIITGATLAVQCYLVKSLEGLVLTFNQGAATTLTKLNIYIQPLPQEVYDAIFA